MRQNGSYFAHLNEDFVDIDGDSTCSLMTVDLQFDENTDPVTGYVALSRVRMADHLVIMQPFNIKTFQKGCNEINGMLLKKVKGTRLQR